MKAVQLVLSFVIAFGFLFGLTAQKSEAIYFTGHRNPLFIVNLGSRNHHGRVNYGIGHGCYFGCGLYGYNVGLHSSLYRQIPFGNTIIRTHDTGRGTTFRHERRIVYTPMYGGHAHVFSHY